MPTTTVGRTKLYYECQGSGPPVVFIAGLGADHHRWDPAVERLRHRYTCITVDNRGVGQSSRPRTGYDMPDLTRDTLGLLKKLSITRTHIVGMSMGGMVALNIALEQPGVAASIVLAGSMAAPDARLLHVLRSRETMQRRMRPYEYTWALAAWMYSSKTLGTPGLVDGFAQRAADNPHPKALHAYRQLVDGIERYDVRASLGKISVPTLVMVGEEDILTPVHLSRELAAGIPGAELVELPGLGHFGVAEDPDAFVAPIARFLDGVAFQLGLAPPR